MNRNKTRSELAQLTTQFALSHNLGAINLITVAHDAWCRMLKGGDVCNCNPEMQVSEIKAVPDAT
jgi:hypothetical protein